jgi:hypothetical protein
MPAPNAHGGGGGTSPRFYRPRSTAKTESSWVSPPKQLQRKDSLRFTRPKGRGGGGGGGGGGERRSSGGRLSGNGGKNGKNGGNFRHGGPGGHGGHGENGQLGGPLSAAGGAARRRGSSSPAPEHVARGGDVPSVSVRVCPRKLNAAWDDPMFEAGGAEIIGGQQGEGEEEEEEEAGGGGGVITVSRDGRKIYCPDDDMVNIRDFQFDSVFDTRATSAKVYAARVANLTPHVAHGGHACIVVAGDAAHAKVATALGRRRGRHRSSDDAIQESDLGVVHFAVAQVLSYLDKDQLEQRDSAKEAAKKKKKRKKKKKKRHSEEEEGAADGSDDDQENGGPSVTLTWYELLGRGSIRDVLAAVSRNEGDGPTPGLSMYDTVGSGVHVPNLLEVEVKNVGDVHRVLQRIRAAEYDESPTGAPLRHSVLSVNVKQYNGRLDVVLLGSPFQEDANPSVGRATSPASYGSDDGSDYSGDGTPVPPARATWSQELVEAVYECSRPQLQKIVPSDRFNISCLLLLLRESVLGRVPSTWIVCVECTIDAVAYTLETLRGAKLIYDTTRRKKAHQWGEESSNSSSSDEDDDEGKRGRAGGEPKLGGTVLHRASSSIAHTTVDAATPRPVAPVRRPSRSAPNAPAEGAAGAAATTTAAEQADPAPSSDAFSFAVSSKDMATFAVAKLREIVAAEGAAQAGHGGGGGGNGGGLGGGGGGNGGMKAHQRKHLVPWFKNILKSSRENEAEAQDLKARLEAMQRRLKRANNSYAVLSSASSKAKQQQHGGNGGADAGKGGVDARTVTDLRTQLKRTQNELHDFAVYKDVMEATLGRVNSEMAAARAEREQAMVLVRKLKGRLKTRAVAAKSRGMDELRQKLSAVSKERQSLTASLEAERKARVAAERKAKRAEQQAENSADAVEMLANEQQRLAAALEEANRKCAAPTHGSSSSSSPKFGMSKVEELQRSVAMLEARNTQLQRQLRQQTKSGGSSSSGSGNGSGNARRRVAAATSVAAATASFSAPTASSSRKVSRVRVSLTKTKPSGAATSASEKNNRNQRASNNNMKKKRIKSPRRSAAETLAKRSSRIKDEEDGVHAVGDEEVAAALAALDDGGIVEPYENHGGQAGRGDDDLEGELSAAAVLERLRKQRMETQAFLNSRQGIGM